MHAKQALQAANPAAYSEEAAEAAEAAYRALAERAKLRLKSLLADPTTQSGPIRQLQNAVRVGALVHRGWLVERAGLVVG